MGDSLLSGQLDFILLRERYLCIEALGLVSHLCSLDKVIDSEGWEAFSCIYVHGEEILQESFRINVENYLGIQAELALKYASLKPSDEFQ